MAEIRALNPDFTGVRRGVEFVRGVGHSSDPETLRALAARGYLVVDEPDDDPAAPPRHGKGSGRDAWVAFACQVTAAAADTWDGMTRDEIIDALADEGLID